MGGDESRSSISLTMGIVSGFANDRQGRWAWIKTDARVNAGNSGGSAYRPVPGGGFEYVGVPSRELIEADDELGYCRPTSAFPERWRELIRADLAGR